MTHVASTSIVAHLIVTPLVTLCKDYVYVEEPAPCNPPKIYWMLRRGSIWHAPSKQGRALRRALHQPCVARIESIRDIAAGRTKRSHAWRKMSLTRSQQGRAAAMQRLQDLLYEHRYSIEAVARAERVSVYAVRWWMRKLHVHVRGAIKLRKQLLGVQ